MRGEFIENYYILNMNLILHLLHSSIPHHTKNFHCFFLWMQQGCLSVYGYLLNIPLQEESRKRKNRLWGRKYLNKTRKNLSFRSQCFLIKIQTGESFFSHKKYRSCVLIPHSCDGMKTNKYSARIRRIGSEYSLRWEEKRKSKNKL